MYRYVTEKEFNKFLNKYPNRGVNIGSGPYVKPDLYYFKTVADSYGHDWSDRCIASARYYESRNAYTYRIWENKKWNPINEFVKFVRRVKIAWKLAGTMTGTKDTRI